ncbi:MAG: iron-containing alcohol dehydrogenase family protein [Lachnospiraceae bacterium]|nr:iron-containing alcohol dehydrogenase family protein [Lachnospiraceae bacterium]
MRFYTPTDIYIEDNSVKNHAKDLARLGTKALIVTGRHSAKANGSQADVTAVLDQVGIPYQIFDQVEENPSVRTVEKGAALGKEFGADFVIGIGGGSPLDASKAIALLIKNPEEDGSCLYTPKNLKALPIVAVPTTCGTGSETTAVSVLTRPELKTKGSISYKLFPDLALVDGKYLKGASQKLLVNTTTDALAHLIESYLHANANDFNRMFSSYGLRLYPDIRPYIEGKKEMDDQAREKMIMISTIGGMAIAQTGTSLPHALSYAITIQYGVAHGRACGLLQAGYLKQYAAKKPEDVQAVLAFLGFESIDQLGAYLAGLLGPQEVSAADLDRYVEDMLHNTGKLATFPFDIAGEGLRVILTEGLTVR